MTPLSWSHSFWLSVRRTTKDYNIFTYTGTCRSYRYSTVSTGMYLFSFFLRVLADWLSVRSVLYSSSLWLTCLFIFRMDTVCTRTSLLKSADSFKLPFHPPLSCAWVCSLHQKESIWNVLCKTGPIEKDIASVRHTSFWFFKRAKIFFLARRTLRECSI